MGRSALTAITGRAAADVSAKRTTRVPFQTPWAGYTPDLAIPAKAPNGLDDCRSLVVRAGVLTTDHGWRKLGAATLPLGHNGDASAFIDAAANEYGGGLVAATTAGNDVTQPVRQLFSFPRFTASAGLGTVEAMAVTADTATIGTGEPPFQETGHLFRRDSTGAWVSVEFDSNDGAGAVVANAVPLSGGLNNWVDSVVYPLGVTGGTIGGNSIVPVAEAVFIFTNHVDQVMYYPDATAGTHYTDFQSYAEQVDDTGLDAATDFYSGTASIFKTLRAKTLAGFDGRVWYGNTVEGGTHHGYRVRRSIVGNPFIVWPGLEIDDAATSVHLTGVGAGFIDFEQFKTPIQRILPLGDLLAVYSKDGIAVVRRTGSNAAPYAVQYLTLDRGLLSPGGVVAINPAQHFAILNDGWYVLNANGTMDEVGLTPAGNVLTGAKEPNYKWKNDFYSRLNETGLDGGHLQMGYDPREQYVRIGAPMGGSPTANEVWIYDIRNNRAFLDDYGSVAGRDQNPLVWANLNQETGVGLSWAEVTAGAADPWSAVTDGGSWESITPSFGATLPSHGDQGGYVYTHDSNLETRDGATPSWSLLCAPHNFGVQGAGDILLQRVDVEYRNNQPSTGPSCAISATGFDVDSGDGTTSGYTESTNINLERGNPGEMSHDYAHFKVVGDHIQLALTGSGAIKIHSMHLELQILESRYRRVEGT